jgi:hypothetical protein
MGVPRLGLGGGSDPRQRDRLLMLLFEAARLDDAAFDLEPPGVRVVGGGLGLALGALQTTPVEIEGIPSQTQTAPDNEQD